MAMINNGRLWLLVTLCVLAPFFFRANAKAQYTPEGELVLKGAVAVPRVGNGPVKTPVKCDGEGNIYLQEYRQGRPGAMPIVKIARDGQNVTQFKLESAPGYEKEGEALGFSVGLRGEVYWLAQRGQAERKVEILVFESDGTFDRSITVQLPSPNDYPRQIVALPSGTFFLAGESVPPGTAAPTPFTALFDEDGRFIKQITVPLKAKNATATGKEARAQVTPSLAFEEAYAGVDGNLYVFRPSGHEVFLWVISPEGEVLRALTLLPPAKGLAPETMRVGAGQVAVQFLQTDKSGNILREVYSFFNPYSGERVIDYQPPAVSTVGIFSCDVPGGLVFLKADQGHLEIQTAALK